MKKILLLILPLLFMACATDITGEYSTHQCSYILSFQYGHTTSYLYSSLNSTNIFCIINAPTKLDNSHNPYKLKSELYGTGTQEEIITEIELTEPTRQIGLNNELIVGRSSFQNGELYVFDRQCPNCYNNYHRKNYALSFKDSQNVQCSNCQRTYGLLNGGVVVAGDGGEKLFRYRAYYNGQQFRISNP